MWTKHRDDDEVKIDDEMKKKELILKMKKEDCNKID